MLAKCKAFESGRLLMSKIDTPSRGRREFIATTSLMMLGSGLSESLLFASPSSSTKPQLLEELTPEEREFVGRSTMAQELEKYFGKGYGCAESGLAVSLRYLEKPDDLLWVAAGFSGGLGHRDLCGFLTAGVMAIGLAAGTLQVERKVAKKRSRLMVKQFWQVWSSMAPLHCSEILEGRKGYKVCDRLGRLASAKLEQILEPTRAGQVTTSPGSVP
jgi:hypothetical protein